MGSDLYQNLQSYFSSHLGTLKTVRSIFLLSQSPHYRIFFPLIYTLCTQPLQSRRPDSLFPSHPPHLTSPHVSLVPLVTHPPFVLHRRPPTLSTTSLSSSTTPRSGIDTPPEPTTSTVSSPTSTDTGSSERRTRGGREFMEFTRFVLQTSSSWFVRISRDGKGRGAREESTFGSRVDEKRARESKGN